MQHFVVTIGREFGSQGLYVGEKLAEYLGVKCYNRELIEEAATRMGEKTEVLNNLDEFIAQKSFGFGAKSEAEKAFMVQSQIICEIAERESCVIVGRCADYVLRDRNDCLNVFISAPYSYKFNHLAEEYKLTPEATTRMMEKNDSNRSNYYKHFAHQNPGTMSHITLDCSYFGVDGTARVLKSIVEMKFNALNE